MPTDLTRVTVLGSHRHADLLLPSDHPVGALIPRVLDLLEEPARGRAAEKLLVTGTGATLSADGTLDEARVLDGAVLTLVDRADAPPPPVIYDVTDAVVERTDAMGGVWTPAWRSAVAAVAGALLLTGVFWVLSPLLSPHGLLPLIGAAAALAVGTAALPRSATRVAGAMLLGTGVASGVLGILLLPATPPLHAVGLAGLALVVLLLLTLVSSTRAVFLGGAITLAVLAALWVLIWVWTATPARAGAVMGIVTLMGLGLVPRIALSGSGLAALDDRRAAGGTLRRTDALAAIASAHRSLTMGTVICAVSLGAALWLLGGDRREPVWSLLLLAVLTAATALRARAFPLAAQRAALYAAALTGVAALVLDLIGRGPATRWLAVAALVVVVAGILIGLLVRAPAHVLAQLRQNGNRAETLLIIASVPLAVGMFGVFAQLLTSFG
ncbi:type VII secretion integral membrane protein EccD [Tersicoccus sp. MR15.9]|uniref:type VII secretion integral membrane protein EccD n=1 Tax=Tersicoccus mangrovi TaxID=3121635 RepID=UPI002FE57C90